MKVRIEDKEALQALSIESLRAYLDRSADWQYAEDIPGKAAVYQHTDKNGRLREVIVPLRRDFADYASRMADAVSTLARVEDRSELDIYDDLSTSGGVAACRAHARISKWLSEEHWTVRDVSDADWPLSFIVTLEGGHVVDIFRHRDFADRITVAQQWGFDAGFVDWFMKLPKHIQQDTLYDIHRDVSLSGLDLARLGVPPREMRLGAWIYLDGLTKDALIQKVLLVVRMYELTRRTFQRAYAESERPPGEIMHIVPRTESLLTAAG